MSKTEPEIVEIIKQCLNNNGIPFKNEKNLNHSARIDFAIYDILGIECKGHCSRRGGKSQKINEQIKKYSKYFKHIWLVTQSSHSAGSLLVPEADKIIPIEYFGDYIDTIKELLKDA